MKRVILISGKAQHGKDTVGELLAQQMTSAGYTVRKLAFADALKDTCIRHFGWNGVKDEQGRSILQQVGTNMARKNNPDVWVNIMIELIKAMSDDYFIITDCRFPNELTKVEQAFKDKTFSIRVTRPNFDNGMTPQQLQHESETGLDNFQWFDVYVENDGNMDDLSYKTKQVTDFIIKLK